MYLVRWDAQYGEYLYYYIRYNLAPAPAPSAPLWQEGLVYVWSSNPRVCPRWGSNPQSLDQIPDAQPLCYTVIAKWWPCHNMTLNIGRNTIRKGLVFSQIESQVTRGSRIENKHATFRQKDLYPKRIHGYYYQIDCVKNYRIELGHLHVGLGEYS